MMDPDVTVDSGLRCTGTEGKGPGTFCSEQSTSQTPCPRRELLHRVHAVAAVAAVTYWIAHVTNDRNGSRIRGWCSLAV